MLAITGQHKFYAALSNFLGIIGYWAGDFQARFCNHRSADLLMTGTTPGAFVSVICIEHLYFRKGKFALYDIRSWNVPSQLPLGAAALGASLSGFALATTSMNQVWYTGPIARKIGDIGFGVAIAVASLCYIPLRHLEKRRRGF